MCAPAGKAGGRSQAKRTALCGKMCHWSFFTKKIKMRFLVGFISDNLVSSLLSVSYNDE